MEVGRHDSARAPVAGGQRQHEGGVIEIGDGSVGSQLHRRVGIELGEGGKLLHFSLRPFLFDSHREHGRDGEEKMDFILGKFSPFSRVGAKNAKGPTLSLNSNRHSADHPMLDQ